jgi:hypothetical protein
LNAGLANACFDQGARHENPSSRICPVRRRDRVWVCNATVGALARLSGAADREATRAALQDETLQQRLIAAGLEPARDSSPEAARRWAEAEIARLAPLINALGLKE